MGGVSMEWKEVVATEYCYKVADGTHDSPKRQNKGRFLITSKHIKGHSIDFDNAYYISEDEYQKIIKRSKIDKWDVIVSMIGEYCGFCYLEDSNFTDYAVKNVGILKVGERIKSLWLYYYLNSPAGRNQLKNTRAGSSQPYISLGSLRNLLIPEPSREVMEGIVAILSSLDRKIELNNKINADLEEMAQAIFKNWFVDFEPFKDDKFVDSELGMIPEGWKVGRLTDVIKLMPGGTPKTSEPLYWDNGTIPFFSPKDVNGVYCFATEKHITEAGLNKCSSNLYPKDTIFITCRGTVGKVCLVACDMAMNQSNYAIKAIDGYSQYYVFFLVKSVVERLIKKSNGAVFSAITSKDFDEEILIPSQNAVEDFTNVIDGFFRRIFTIGTENYRLSLLRDTLLPRLMSGELEVPE